MGFGIWVPVLSCPMTSLGKGGLRWESPAAPQAGEWDGGGFLLHPKQKELEISPVVPWAVRSWDQDAPVAG